MEHQLHQQIFTERQKLLFWARMRRQTLLMLLGTTSISHIWYPNYSDGLAPPCSMSTLELLERSDICGMAQGGHKLSLSSGWSEGLGFRSFSLSSQITRCSCLWGPREVAALRTGWSVRAWSPSATWNMKTHMILVMLSSSLLSPCNWMQLETEAEGRGEKTH